MCQAAGRVVFVVLLGLWGIGRRRQKEVRGTSRQANTMIRGTGNFVQDLRGGVRSLGDEIELLGSQIISPIQQ